MTVKTNFVDIFIGFKMPELIEWKQVCSPLKVKELCSMEHNKFLSN